MRIASNGNMICYVKTRNQEFYQWDRRIASFWERARQREVFPVPGGPCKRITRFQETRFTRGNKEGKEENHLDVVKTHDQRLHH